MAARNTYRIEINIHEKLCVKLVICKDDVLIFPSILRLKMPYSLPTVRFRELNHYGA